MANGIPGTTIRRRIHRRMVLHGSDKPENYIAYLQENPAEARALADDLLICVTSFFREPEALEALAAKVFPEILKGRSPENPIRIWVAGCATGEEAYSVAICLTEFLERSGANVPFQIFATDISERAVEKAPAGIYGMPALAEVSPARLKRFFVKANGGFRIARSIRESCTIARQNIVKDPPFHNLDLITCCNVLIYFGPVLQRKALATFHYALKPGGFLMLGPSESVGPLSHAFSPLDKKLRLYSKQPGADPLNLHVLAGELTEARDSVAAAAGGQTRVALDVQKTAERMLLAQYAPAGVIVDDALNVVHVRGDTGAYLQVASGEPTYSLLKMAREDLVVALRTALLKARQRKAAVSQQVEVTENGQMREVHLKVVPINGTGGGTGRADALHFLVLFEGAQPAAPPVPVQDEAKRPKAAANEPAGAKTAGPRGARENARLKQELGATREYLQAIIEEQEASTEELKSANEEAQASNEELETAKEELQSANEELNTVNDELKTRNVALTEVNNDLTNVLTGINVPLVMVGRDLNIRRFTPSMEPMLNLIDSDIGRSISDLKPNIDVPDLPELLRGVVHGGSPARREIEDPQGRWYSLQVLPYRAPDDKVDGALLVLLDIDAIRRSRDFAEAIVETVPLPLLVLTGDLRIQSANLAFYQAFKVRKEESENRLIYDLGNGQWNIPKLRQALENVLPKAGGFQDFEVTHEFESIGRRTMLLSAREIEQPLPYGRTILLAIEDVTEREQAQEAQQRLASIVESSNDAIISKDLKGVIQSWNRGAERMFGYTAGEAVGQHISLLAPPGRKDEFPDILARISRGELVDHYHTRRRAKDGRILDVSLTVSPLRDAAGGIIGASKIARDITEEKRDEERMRQLNDDLKHFAYAASHDLQEPLRMVTSYTQLLAKEYKGQLGKDADQFIGYAVEGAQRMEDLLKGMREYWQTSERAEEHHAAVDCNEVLKKALLNLQKTITDDGAVVTHKRLPTIRAEEVALIQLFQNLIGNAIKYRSKKPPQVEISAVKNGNEEWVFSVKDNGIGIDPQYAEKIFGMFNRLNGRKYPGSGIGLAICRKVVERLGGRIWVESEKGRGADFKFTIPRKD